MTATTDLLEIVAWLQTHADPHARLTLDSRQVHPGDVFVAVRGARHDGLQFASVAVARGASAILCEVRDDLKSHTLAVPILPVSDLQRRLGEITASFYGHPSATMQGVAVTGTNGKTSTSQWVAQLLTHIGTPCAAIGTIGTSLAGRPFDAPALTTPDAASTQRLFLELKEAGAQAFAIEASSIGLEQARLAGTAIDVAIFTNLTRDHLDYHKTMEAYAQAKGILFDWPGLKCAVVNVDDPAGVTYARQALARGVRTIVTTQHPERLSNAELVGAEVFAAKDVQAQVCGMRVTLSFGDDCRTLDLPVLGRFNVDNVLSSAGALLGLGYDFIQVCQSLVALVPPAGRLEMIARSGAPLIVVDYAHTPDALTKALEALREVAKIRDDAPLTCVFGCGGDRDRGKRPLMMKAALDLADYVWVTSDNPRTEDPQQILQDIVAETSPNIRHTVIADRQAAIDAAVQGTPVNGIVLIAGKGHETYQDIQGVKHHFSDIEAAHRAINHRKTSMAS